ncbi:hypothetical protein [Tenacibaculum caenipelagi]|uniref:Bacteriocin-like protein n=1 Tax=Tenacibaculum caenipelagi TaxID=1325435 RepID=A0A4V3D3I4_9FLAO|nr:hypothetical protein [Tenacibaculum caenipelagi]TDQ29942.1 hypothetical protein DFQ07_0268 [Tenacibaculum caenipelagi]
MLKNISNLGTTLNKTEQQFINGGKKQCLLPDNTCSEIWIGCGEPQCQPQPF